MSKREIQMAISLFEAIDDTNISNIIVLLEKHNANPNVIIPKLGISPFHFAAGYEDLDFAEKVIEIFLKKNAQINLFSDCESKLTPLHIACVWNRPKIVKMLLENGADIDLKCNEGHTATEYAIIEQNFDVIHVIQRFIFEQKIERKKKEVILLQKSQERVETPIEDDGSETAPSTPLKSSLTRVLQNIEKKKFTPNRINYNFDVTSPYYINVTHRRHKSRLEIDDNEENEKKAEAQAGSVEVSKNLFELTRKNLKEFSKQVNKAIVINRIAIHKRRSYILEWREKIQQYLNEENYDNSYLNSCNIFTDNSSCKSTVVDDLMNEIKSSSDSFITAKSDLMRCDNAIINNAFIAEEASNLECIESILEHSDNESGIKLFERNIKNRNSTLLRINDENAAESSISTVVSIPLDYDTDTLKEELKTFGRTPGPITKSTKKLYLRQLMKFKKHPERLGLVQEDSSRITYPQELQRTVVSYENLTQNIKDFLALETKMVNCFIEKAHLKWREGNSKTSFVYLLLDPRITQNLPLYHTQMEKSEVWEKFLNSIFYVGKGKRSRPYQHLYDAIKILSDGDKAKNKTVESNKLSRIVEIWKENSGVVCLHIFHNIMPCEAFSREASIIETLGIHNLTNVKKGEFYGASTCFTMRQKRQMGIALLYRALNIYLAEGESQLKPCDF